MSPLKRWRTAIPLTLLSALPLGATLLGAWAYWGVDNTSRNVLTLFLVLMFTMCVGISLSIGFDRKLTDVPWLRIGTVALFMVLACGVGWVRDLV